MNNFRVSRMGLAISIIKQTDEYTSDTSNSNKSNSEKSVSDKSNSNKSVSDKSNSNKSPEIELNIELNQPNLNQPNLNPPNLNQPNLNQPSASWGFRTYTYNGQNSEGNRFIKNNDL